MEFCGRMGGYRSMLIWGDERLLCEPRKRDEKEESGDESNARCGTRSSLRGVKTVASVVTIPI